MLVVLEKWLCHGEDIDFVVVFDSSYRIVRGRRLFHLLIGCAELADKIVHQERHGELSVRQLSFSGVRGSSVSYDMISTVVPVKAERPSTHPIRRARRW